MDEVIADKNYFYDAEGNVTTDESKGERWLAREGANVMEEHREALKAFQSSDMSDANNGDKVAPEGDEKSSGPKANKAEKPAKNKGAK